jgi:glycosyltransferase involved in cell wall biosynthesis
METEEDAAFRVRAVDFCDRLMQNIVNEPIQLGLPQRFRDVYTAMFVRAFTNQDIMKEKNLNGYYLTKMTGGKHHILFGNRDTDYPFLKYVPDVDLQLINPQEPFTKTAKDYFTDNADKMDILILQYPDDLSAKFEFYFKSLRNDAKIVIINEVNRQFLNAGFGMTPDLVQPYFCSADAVVVSSCDLRDRLNSNPENKFPTFLLRYAFSNVIGEDLSVCADDKDNIILTVGNLDLDCKNIESLIEAFAKVENSISKWKLVLVGGINQSYHDSILEKYASIKDRIIFTGPLDKPELYNWYKRSKIFCMSTLCDATPLVCAEAMAFGCYQILPDSMDGAADLTRNGEFGMVYEQERYIVRPDLFKYGYIPDYQGEAEINLGNALVDAAHRLDYNFFKTFIPKSRFLQETEFDYANNARKLALLLFA